MITIIAATARTAMPTCPQTLPALACLPGTALAYGGGFQGTGLSGSSRHESVVAVNDLRTKSRLDVVPTLGRPPV